MDNSRNKKVLKTESTALYKVLEKQNQKSETEYKNYKKLFEPIKRRLKKLNFSKLILKYKSKIKKSWQIMKKAIGKEKCNQHRFATKIVVDKESIINIYSIAES